MFQTYLLSSVLTVLLILQLISLFVRWKKGVFWIFRLHSTKFGRILIPNGIITWSITSAIFLVLLQGFYAAMRKYCKPGEDLNNDMLWRSCIWVSRVIFLSLFATAADLGFIDRFHSTWELGV